MTTNVSLKSKVVSGQSSCDHRFIASEQKLKKILLEMAQADYGISFSVTEFCNRGDFNRRTFYRHYSSVSQLISAQVKAHKNAIKAFVANLLENGLSYEVNLYKILFFINKHKIDYEASLVHANFFFFHVFSEAMKPFVLKEWNIPQTNNPAEDINFNKKYTNFSFEVIAELVWWIQFEDAKKSKIPYLVNFIMATLRKYRD